MEGKARRSMPQPKKLGNFPRAMGGTLPWLLCSGCSLGLPFLELRAKPGAGAPPSGQQSQAAEDTFAGGGGREEGSSLSGYPYSICNTSCSSLQVLQSILGIESHLQPGGGGARL